MTVLADLPASQKAVWTQVIERLSRRDYRYDPAAWAMDKLGVHLWSKQQEIGRSLVDNRRTAVKSCHGAGKSFSAAVLALWWIDVHPPGEAIVVTTAPSYEQVHVVLWEEIRRLHALGNMEGDVQRSDRWLDPAGRLVGIGRRPPDHSESAFQGIHKRYVLVILDEAGGIPAWLWTAAEAITTGDDCRILAIGNPDDNSSEFARMCDSPFFHMIQISAFVTPLFTGEDVPDALKHVLISPGVVEDWKGKWGETNPLYMAKVLAEFADSEDGLIPLSWVRAAVLRWQAWHDAGEREVGGRRIIGVDVARYGTDSTVLAIREGDVIRELKAHNGLDTVQTTAYVEHELNFPKAVSIVDVIGVGAGVVDMLRANKRNVMPFNAAMATTRTDSTGQWKFPNRRSAAWWNLRELLDPSAGATICLPDDDLLIADLVTPQWKIGTGNKLIVESKDSMRKRLNRSTDYGDAVCMAFWHQPSTGRQKPERDPSQIRKPSARPWGDPESW